MLNHFAAHLHLRYMYNVRNRHYIASKHAEYVFSAGIEIAIAMAIKAKKKLIPRTFITYYFERARTSLPTTCHDKWHWGANSALQFILFD